MKTIKQRLVELEQTSPTATRLHCLHRYDGETDEQAIAAYEREHGSVGGGNAVMRVIIEKPGERPQGATDRIGPGAGMGRA